MLAVGGLVVYGLASIGHKAAKRNYKSWLKFVTSLAKLELDLGLEESRAQITGDNTSKNWTATESIAYPEWIWNHNKYATSRAFVKAKMKEGYIHTLSILFCTVKTIAALLIIFGVWICGILNW